MTIYILTLFPEIFESVFSKSITKRALDKKLVVIKYLNLREWGIGAHKTVDDKPYGGGQGMVMMVEPIELALNSIKPKPYTILLSASGQKYNQRTAQELAGKQTLALICGHYEGVDARVESLVDKVITIGDYVLTGGEIPAMLIVDTVTRLIPEVIKKKSLEEESFSGIENLKLKINNYLEYPQYTRPEVYKNMKVPGVLLKGNHAEITKWRRDESKKRLAEFRPDLLSKKA